MLDRRAARRSFSMCFALVASALLSQCNYGDADSESEPVVVRACPEAVRTSERGNPVGVTSGQIRYCWPGEAHCFCDRDGDCYAEEGYVRCTPPAPDAGGAADATADVARAVDATADVARVVDASADVARALDATADAPARTDAVVAARNVCPEAVRTSARGNPVGVTSGRVRYCWPGEAHCFCDRDGDCYAEGGYVPCTPPTTSSPVDASMSAPDVRVVDASMSAPDVRAVDAAVASPDVPRVDATVTAPTPLATDPVAYSGSFTGASGYYTARLTVMGESRSVWVYAPATRGANPPLVVAFHGTNADGDVMINDSGLRALADAEGIVVVAPNSRWFGGEGADYDHPGGNGTYWETRNANVDTNADLVLARAAIVEAQRRYATNPDRVYAVGHSNGGFMALLVSVTLRDRIAAFAENSAGMVTCATRPGCAFQGSSTTCSGLAAEGGWCGCTGYQLPVGIPTSGRRVPGYLAHGTQDPMVSVYYTCALASRLGAAGVTAQVALRAGGHDLPGSFARSAWTFLAAQRRQ
ncbi:MAG: PHB depolymerase family esterase [Polyangiales bacterium]